MAKSKDQDTYYPQSGEYGGYCGNLNNLDDREEYKQRDAEVDATRAEFAKPKVSRVTDD
jgi:hypothetical protein